MEYLEVFFICLFQVFFILVLCSQTQFGHCIARAGLAMQDYMCIHISCYGPAFRNPFNWKDLK